MPLYVLPANHTSAKSSYKMQYIIERYKVKTILLEGINIHSMKLLRDPVLTAILWCWSFIISFTSGQEELAHRKAAVTYIDASVDQLRTAFTRWYNPLLFGIICTSLLLIFDINLVNIIVALCITSLLYLLYFALRTKGVREATFIAHAKKHTEAKENVLIVCGKAHATALQESLPCTVL
jgi:hypothetical protein